MSRKTRKIRDNRTERNKTKLNKTFKKYNKKSAYPWKKITKKMAIDDFKGLKKVDEMNWRSTKGIRIVDYGTYKLRMRTKYRGKSNVERWNNKTSREKMLGFAQRLALGSYNRGNIKNEEIIRSAISLAWATVNSMRPAFAMNMYKAYGATRVLDITAGWGGRMVGAMAADIDYIGIDSNQKLKPEYHKIKNLIQKEKLSKSNVTLKFQRAETVDFSKLGYYDFVFTSPPYEYLELYEGMEKYDGNVGQASSGNKLKGRPEFYDKFLIPTLKSAYKYLPTGKFLCLNMPDSMYDEIKKRWKKADDCKSDYLIAKRHGSTMKVSERKGKEKVFCWKSKNYFFQKN